MESISGPVPNNPVKIEPSIININWSCVNVISDVNFTVNCPFIPCILSNVNKKPMGVIQLFCDHPDSTWEHVNIIPSRALTNITKGPEYTVSRDFTNSVPADMDFRHCLSPYCFIDQVFFSCMGLLMKGPWFIFTHTVIGEGVSFAYINKAIKACCASTSSGGTSVFERCCQSPEGFTEFLQRGSRKRETRYSQITPQRPDILIYIPHLLAHAVLTSDTGSPTILSGRDATTTPTTNQQIVIQTLDEYTFPVRCGKWREIFRKKGLSTIRESVFSPSTWPLESRDRLQKHWIYWKNTLSIFIVITHRKRGAP